MAEKIEDIDSKTDEEDIDSKNNDDSSDDEEFEDTDDVEVLKQQKADLVKKQQSTYEQLKKAKGYERGDDGKWTKKSKPVVEEKPKVTEKVVTDESVINKVLDKRELESLDLSDSLKKEVETYAKVQGISVKKALNSEYISFLKDKEDKKEKIDNASLGSRRRTNTKKDYSEMTASDFDLKTPEGKAEFKKFEEHLAKELG